MRQVSLHLLKLSLTLISELLPLSEFMLVLKFLSCFLILLASLFKVLLTHWGCVGFRDLEHVPQTLIFLLKLSDDLLVFEV